MTAIAPGATIGFLGGGQLGRMSAMAARAMGYDVHVLDPDPHCPARAVADRCVTAAFDDADAAAELARHCAVVTLEIEQIGSAALEAAEHHAPVRPGPAVIRMIQDRASQKAWLRARGFPLGAYRDVDSAASLAEAVEALGTVFAKSTRGGYDGRSQARVSDVADAAEAWRSLGQRPLVAEQALDLECELSVLVARRPSGELRAFPAALNHHERQVLAWSVLPAPLPQTVTSRAGELACAIADDARLEGVLAVEMFLTRDGALLVNELAPRPHNSYHASELACPTSQFEQHVRAVCDLPLGTVLPARPAAIVNLFGELWIAGRAPDWSLALAVPGTRLHLYGKRAARAGRKMGHLSAAGDTAEGALRTAQAAFACLAPSVSDRSA